jgi:phosphohistidine phosphatase
MKTLFLLRHAKSSWDDPSLQDFDRPLAERGRRDAPRIGSALAERSGLPELIVSSPAVRAIQTIELVAKSAGYKGEIELDEHVYGASASELIKIVRNLPDNRSSIMLVGHNPGFEDLLSRLIGSRREMSTCNLACVGYSIERWDELEDGGGNLQWLLRPKDL